MQKQPINAKLLCVLVFILALITGAKACCAPIPVGGFGWGAGWGAGGFGFGGGYPIFGPPFGAPGLFAGGIGVFGIGFAPAIPVLGLDKFPVSPFDIQAFGPGLLPF